MHEIFKSNALRSVDKRTSLQGAHVRGSSFRRSICSACTLEYVYHGLNNAIHDNGKLCRFMYLQHIHTALLVSGA